MPTALQVDLGANELLLCRGYPEGEPRVAGAQVRAALRHRVGRRTFFVRGRFHGLDGAAGLRRRLAAFTEEDAPAWAGGLQGDFTVVAWNHAEGRITAVTDRVGAHRLLVHRSPAGVVTITDSLISQVRLQPAPRLDHLGAYTLLALQYPLDPHTLLAETLALTVGDIARVSADSLRLLSYHQPVQEEVEAFDSVERCLAALDLALEQAMAAALTEDEEPLLLLSGGIDSTVLLDYLSRLAPGRVHTLTFATEDHPGEMAPARLAAEHYRTTHHELVIPRREVEGLARAALLATDSTSFGGYVHMALRRWLAAHHRPLTVFRGEDARLHTPTLDLPALIGLAAHRAGLHRSPAGRRLWRARRLAAAWPLRTGRNYIRYALERTELQQDLGAYLLRIGARFCPPPGHPVPPELLERTRGLGGRSSLDRAHRALVGLTYRLQSTEDLHVARATNETDNSTLAVPYYDPQVAQVFNRVPLRMSMRPVWAPGRTGSPVPVAGKYILRRLVADTAPPQLLCRRKATAPAEDVLSAEAGPRTIFPVLRDWGPALLDQLQGAPRDMAQEQLRRCLDGGLRPPPDQRLGLTSCLFHLVTLARLCAEPTLDLDAALDALEPWTG